jgi:ribosomal protein S18 acetylase RimI-like enzyme
MSTLALLPPDAAVKIRPVRISDTSALHENCWPERTYEEVYQLVRRAQQIAGQGRGLGIVALGEDGASVIGYGQLTAWPNCGELSDLVVTPAYRGRGLGTTLIQYLTRAAREMHLPCVEIGAVVSNQRALALYRRLGFKDSHTLSFRGQRNEEDVVILRLVW